MWKWGGVVEKTIKTFNLTDAIKLTGCTPTHIKMGIERMELQVIKGNLDFIAKNSFKFAIACYHVVDGERTDERLIKMFQSIGYKTELVFPEHLTLQAWLENWTIVQFIAEILLSGKLDILINWPVFAYHIFGVLLIFCRGEK